MIITDADYQDWLDSANASRVVLIEAEYRDVYGTVGTEYMALKPYMSAPNDTPANQPYRAIVAEIPTLSQTMSDVLVGRTTANIGSLSVLAIDTTTDTWVMYRDWIGRPIRLLLGDPSWERFNFRTLWDGVVADLSVSGTSLIKFELRDQQHLLNQPPTRSVIGPSSWGAANRPAPLCYGKCKNVTPSLIMGRPFQYQVHDGPIEAIDVVYSNGVALSTATYAVDLTTGSFTIPVTANVTGEITCDVRGAVDGDGNRIDTAAKIIYDLAVTRGPLSFALTDLDDFAATCPQALGLFASSESVMTYELIDQVITSVGAYYSIDRDGNFYAKQFRFPIDGRNDTVEGGDAYVVLLDPPVMNIEPRQMASGGFAIEKVYQPVPQVMLGYDRAWTAQKNIAAAAADDQRSFVANGMYVATATNAYVSDYAKIVDKGLQETLLTDATDAQNEADRRIRLWNQVRVLVKLACYTHPARLKLGDSVFVTHPRHSFASGKFGVVVSMAGGAGQDITLGVLV